MLLDKSDRVKIKKRLNELDEKTRVTRSEK